MMLAALISATLGLSTSQATPSTPARPAPPVEFQTGTNEWFQSTALSAMRLMESGKFTEASRILARLPDRTVTVFWDESAVPANQRGEFQAARKRAFDAWASIVPDLKFQFVTRGAEIHLGFAPTLPPNADSPGPAGAVFLTSPSPEDPTVDAVIALRRGAQGLPTTALDVSNEIVYAIGTHLGLARIPVPSTAMFRREERYNDFNKPLFAQGGTVARNLELIQRLRQDAASRRAVQFALPKLAINPTKFDAGSTVQGDVIQFSVQLTNPGRSPLRYTIVPDCGCFVVRQGAPIQPGETIAVPISILTREFPGNQRKNLFIYSNDPEASLRVLPVTFYAAPRFRFLWNEPSDTLIVGESGRSATLFLTYDPRQPIEVVGMTITGGATGSVSYEPWEGELADPQLGEGPRPRKGYRIDLLFGPNIGTGRREVGLEVETRDQVFRFVRHNFYLQRGIVALPSSVFFGQIGNEELRAVAMLRQPGRPFRITRIESDHAAIRATSERLKDGSEYRITVVYSGKADAGDLEATITIHTDDPSQPVIVIPVSAVVR